MRELVDQLMFFSWPTGILAVVGLGLVSAAAGVIAAKRDAAK